MTWVPVLDRCEPYLKLLKEVSLKYSLNPDLVLAMVFQESSGYPMSYRVEKGINLTYQPTVHSKKLLISYDTECVFQNTSWGLLHPLGVKTRELGYSDHLPLLLQPEVGLEWGCKAIGSFKKVFPYERDYIASYNGGAGAVVRKTMMGYQNQKYVDDVVFKWGVLEKLNLFI